MAFIKHDCLEHLNLRTEDHVFQPEGLAVSFDVPYEIFPEAFVVDDCHVEHLHLENVGPRGAVGVVEDKGFLDRKSVV